MPFKDAEEQKKYSRKYYEKNRERIIARVKKYYKKNRERGIKMRAIWEKRNRIKRNRQKKEYRKKLKKNGVCPSCCCPIVDKGHVNCINCRTKITKMKGLKEVRIAINKMES